MQSRAASVDAYLQEVPAERKACLQRLRDLCLEVLQGYEEIMAYGMPAYHKDGVGGVGFASQKNYISFYVLKQDALLAHREQLKGLSVGKGCIRFPRPEKIDFELIRSLLNATVQSEMGACGPRIKG